MDYGLMEVAKAASERITQLDTVTNNLANASTPGFKMENFYPGAPDSEAAKEGPIELQSRVMTDYGQGTIKQTGNALDLAIEGDGFFAIQTKTGTVYTRKGSFTLDKNNRMVTLSGDYVLGDKGPVTLASNNFSISSAGNIVMDGSPADRLRIVSFDKPQLLTRTKEGMFKDSGSAGAKRQEKPEIKSRYIEMSNVNVITEMVEMINVQRSFETYQKVIRSIADLDKLAVSRVGRMA